MTNTAAFSQDDIGQGLAVALGVADEVELEQLRLGMEVELEHGRRDPLTNVTNDDSLLTAKIALAHLRELPDYYVRLAVMEAAAEGRSPVVGDLMTPKPLTVSADEPLVAADRLLREHRVSGLPVVERDGRLVGVLSRTDLMALASDEPAGAWHGQAVRTAMTAPAITILAGRHVDRGRRPDGRASRPPARGDRAREQQSDRDPVDDSTWCAQSPAGSGPPRRSSHRPDSMVWVARTSHSG